MSTNSADSNSQECMYLSVVNGYGVKYWDLGFLDYTECTRRDLQHPRRTFFILHYTNITQHSYIQSWTAMNIRKRWVLMN